jgi:hypothetical protein
MVTGVLDFEDHVRYFFIMEVSALSSVEVTSWLDCAR